MYEVTHNRFQLKKTNKQQTFVKYSVCLYRSLQRSLSRGTEAQGCRDGLIVADAEHDKIPKKSRFRKGNESLRNGKNIVVNCLSCGRNAVLVSDYKLAGIVLFGAR